MTSRTTPLPWPTRFFRSSLTWLSVIGLSGALQLQAADGGSIRVQPPKKHKASPNKPATAETEWNPFVWKVSKEGVAPSYLLGTIHLPSKATLKLPPAAEEAFKKAEAVFCEIAFDSTAQQKVAAAISKAPKPLTEILPKDLAERCEKALQGIDSSLHLADFDGMETWALAIQLVILEDHFKNPDVLPLDPRLYQMAQRAGKSVGGLETVEEQTSAMSSSADDQVALLKATLDEMEDAAKAGHPVSKPLLDAFLKGDLEALQAHFEKTLNRYPTGLRAAFEKNLLTTRNHTLAARIVKQITGNASRSHLFAIGSGHFVGAEGLPALLQKEGFTVERVSNPAPSAREKKRESR